MPHVQGQKRSIKCAYRENVCKVIVRMHIDYLFPIGNKNDWKWKYILFSTLHTFHSTLWNDRNCPILDHYENRIIPISFYTSHFLPKGATSCSRLLINFKYNNYIQGKKPILAERKMDVMVTQQKGKSNSPFRSFVKSFCTLIWNFNIFSWISNSCGKSILRKIGRRSEISRAGTNKLEGTICVTFVTITFKTWDNIPSIVFCCFLTGLMYDNFFRKGFKSIMS